MMGMNYACHMSENLLTKKDINVALEPDMCCKIIGDSRGVGKWGWREGAQASLLNFNLGGKL